MCIYILYIYTHNIEERIQLSRTKNNDKDKSQNKSIKK